MKRQPQKPIGEKEGVDEEDYLMDIDELSERLNIPKNTIYDWCAFRKIPHIKLGKLIRFRQKEINNWLADNRIGTNQN